MKVIDVSELERVAGGATPESPIQLPGGGTYDPITGKTTPGNGEGWSTDQGGQA
jgi:hypothetical protein